MYRPPMASLVVMALGPTSINVRDFGLLWSFCCLL